MLPCYHTFICTAKTSIFTFYHEKRHITNSTRIPPSSRLVSFVSICLTPPLPEWPTKHQENKIVGQTLKYFMTSLKKKKIVGPFQSIFLSAAIICQTPTPPFVSNFSNCQTLPPILSANVSICQAPSLSFGRWHNLWMAPYWCLFFPMTFAPVFISSLFVCSSFLHLADTCTPHNVQINWLLCSKGKVRLIHYWVWFGNDLNLGWCITGHLSLVSLLLLLAWQVPQSVFGLCYLSYAIEICNFHDVFCLLLHNSCKWYKTKR